MQLIKQNILIADDHGMIRRGISLLIQTEIGSFTIMEAESCTKVMGVLQQNYITHLILDIIFADGNALEILPNIRSLYPSLKILIFSMQPAEIHGEAMKQFGIQHYLSKTSDNDTVIKVLSCFLNNEKSTDDNVHMVSSINPFKSLTSRELQVLHYLLNGFGTKQIAETLNLKMNSVSTLKKRIFLKTETENFKALIDLCSLHKINY